MFNHRRELLLGNGTGGNLSRITNRLGVSLSLLIESLEAIVGTILSRGCILWRRRTSFGGFLLGEDWHSRLYREIIQQAKDTPVCNGMKLAPRPSPNTSPPESYPIDVQPMRLNAPSHSDWFYEYYQSQSLR